MTNDRIWQQYMKKYRKVGKVYQLSKHDGHALHCKHGFIIPYSIDNEELLYVGTDSSVHRLVRLLRLPHVRVLSFGVDNISLIIPESEFSEKVMSILQVRRR